ncbi:MAG: type II toxin-antitoxin system RelE/ParE family toxin [Pyrinomonadaceae bacterium]
MKYTLAPSARRDLNEIWDYIAQDNVDAADRVLEQFAEKFDLLAVHKLIGRQEDRYGRGIRVLPHNAYLIFYLSDREAIEVVRVIHSARDIPTIMENDLLN